MKTKEIISDKEYWVENGIYIPIVKETPYEEAGGTYKVEMINNQFEILVPNLETPEEIDREKLDTWGRARFRYLEEENPMELENLMNSNQLTRHLMEIQEQIEKFKEKEMPKMMEVWGITEELKRKDQMKWVGLYNNLRSSMREIIQKQFIEV